MMFSGIIKEIGIVNDLRHKSGLLEITISAKDVINNLKIGNSIAVDGCCQTIVETTQHSFTVQAIQETLLKTNFSKLKIGSKVNLELPLKLEDRIDGHLVLGHVDSAGEISEIIKEEENEIVKVLFPKELNNFIAPKGSISVNGVSLTVVDSKKYEFSFSLIPYTRDNTNLGLLREGDLVNLEIDLVSRYLINYLKESYAVRT